MKKNNTSLHVASEQGNIEAVRTLLAAPTTKGEDYHVDVNARNNEGKTALMLAVECGNKQTVEVLLRSGVHASNGRQRKAAAAFSKSLIYVRVVGSKIPETGRREFVNVEAQDEHGRTALILAAIQGHGTILRALLEHGADVNACDVYGSNALHAAVQCFDDSCGPIIETLLDNGINIDGPTHNGDSPLHVATIYGTSDPKAVEFLLSYGAAFNTRNKLGQTALHLGMLNDATRYVEALRSVDPTIKDARMRTALYFITCAACRREISDKISTLSTFRAMDDERRRTKRGKFAELLFDGKTLEEFQGNVLEYWYRHMYDYYFYSHGITYECPYETHDNGFLLGVDVASKLADFQLSDKRERTVLHLFLILRWGEFPINILFENIKDVSSRQIYSSGKDRETYNLWRIINRIVGNHKEMAARVDDRARTALHYIALLTRVTSDPYSKLKKVSDLQKSLVDAILSSSDPFNARDKYGRTALHYAAVNGTGPLGKNGYESLTKAGADSNVADMYDETPEDMQRAYETYQQFFKRSDRIFDIEVGIQESVEAARFSFQIHKSKTDSNGLHLGWLASTQWQP